MARSIVIDRPVFVVVPIDSGICAHVRFQIGTGAGNNIGVAAPFDGRNANKEERNVANKTRPACKRSEAANGEAWESMLSARKKALANLACR